MTVTDFGYMIGDCVITRVGKRVRVDRADPLILIAPELLDSLRLGQAARGVRLRGDRLRIRAINRSVTYWLGATASDGHSRYAIRDDCRIRVRG